MPLKLYRRSGSNVWHYRGTLAGDRLRGSTGATDRKAAQRLAAEVEARYWERGLDKKNLTFPKAVALYLAAGKSDRFLDKLEDYWKNEKISKINKGAIRQAAIELYPECTGATRNRQVIVPMLAIINHCAELELCQKLSMKRFEVETEVKKPATKEWIEAFCAHAVSPKISALALFLFATGARISEALQLEWSDFDFQKRTVRIKQTKIGVERLAHLPLKPMLAVANLPRDKPPFFFPFVHFSSRGEAYDQWRATTKAAGIEYLSFHSCRHGFATGLLRAGVDVMTVAKLGGWKSAQHVFQTYGHANDDPTLTERLFDTQVDTTKRQLEQDQ